METYLVAPALEPNRSMTPAHGRFVYAGPSSNSEPVSSGCLPRSSDQSAMVPGAPKPLVSLAWLGLLT